MDRFAELIAVVARLRGPDGCPWDREQTPESLRPCLLEETYEALDAIAAGDPASLRDELGDVLLQIVMQAGIAEERDQFSIDDVVAGVTAKMVRRHPHVFGDVQVRDTAEVLRNWSRIKSEEHRAKGDGTRRSVLGDLPGSLPALNAAHRMGEKASRVALDWPSARAALGKVREELQELEEAMDAGAPDRVEAELGDLLFAVASVGRLAECNAEMALRSALGRFAARLHRIEAWLAAEGRDIHALSAAEMDALWQRAKAAER